MQETSERNTRALDSSTDGQHPDSNPLNQNSDRNRLSSSPLSAEKGLARQAEISLRNSAEQPRLPINFDAIDNGMLDRSSIFDYPAAWADGMFLDDL